MVVHIFLLSLYCTLNDRKIMSTTKKSLIKSIKQIMHLLELKKFYYHSPNDDDFNNKHVDDLNEMYYFNGDQDYDFIDYIKLDDNDKLIYVSREGNEYDEQQLLHQEFEMIASMLLHASSNDFIQMNKNLQV